MKKLLKHLISMREASRGLRSADAALKNQVLVTTAQTLLDRKSDILKANDKDIKALPKNTSSAFIDRLKLNDVRIDHMAESLRQVAALPDPVSEVVESKTLSNGLNLRRIRSPLGVIMMIFESRPNVAIEAFSLGFKAGNTMILKGGGESMHTTSLLYEILSEGLMTHGFSPACLWGITTSDRSITNWLLKQRSHIDVVVPRGGDKLIDYVVKNSLIPIIKNDRGVCHVYVHEDAQAEMAVQIIINAKVQRPGVCNSMETLLIHEDRAQEILPLLCKRLGEIPVQCFGCPKTVKILKGVKNVKRASVKSWSTEYLDFKMNCKVVKGLREAIDHIDKYGSNHSEAIITDSQPIARQFQEEVDSAAVYWNASTRFTDGFEFGLGGELGISTQKIHVRGPVGLKELTSLRWIIDGTGQIRS